MFQIANPLKLLKTAALIFIMVAACYAPVQAHPGHMKARKHGGHGFRDCPWRMVPYHGHFVGRHICGAGNFQTSILVDAKACGYIGPNAEYLSEKHQHCKKYGFDDPLLENLQELVAAELINSNSRR